MKHPVRAAVALSLILVIPGGAQAQDKERVPLPDVVAPRKATRKRATLPKRSAPRFTLERFVATKSKQVEDARQRVIDRLDAIISRTPRTDPDYPEYLYRKALLYEERARFYFHRAMRRDDAPVEKGAEAQKRHEAVKKADLARSRKARLSTLKVWAEIYKGFPSYKHADQALFNLADNLTKLDQGKKALGYYTELIKRFPESKLVPDAFLAIGEYYFDHDDMKTANKAYERVAFFKKSRLYGFAIYKQAWCHYNLGAYKTSMRKFIEVIRYSEGVAADKNKLDLHNEARRELILAYSNAAPATNGQTFFTQVPAKGGAEYWKWVKPRLAGVYYDQGKFKDAIYLFQQLVEEFPGTAQTVRWQLQVVRAQLAIGGRAAVSEQIFTLIKTYKGMKPKDEEEKVSIRRRVEEMIRSLAITYHRDAIKLKSKEVYGLAADLYRAYVDAFGVELKHSYEMQFFLGELLYTSQRWEDSGDQYLKVAKGNPDGKYSQKAVYAAIVSYNKALKSSSLAGGQTTTLKREGKVPPPMPIPGLLQKMAEACGLFLAKVPADKADKAPDVAYRLARIYYEHYHFKEAAAHFETFLQRFGTHELAIYAGHSLLDSLNALGDFTRLAAWGKRLLKHQAVTSRTDFRDEVSDVTQGATLKNIAQLTREGKHLEATRAYDDFLKRYPKSRYLEKVLHNAATAYRKIGRPTRAIELRERLVRTFPRSTLAAPAMFAIGQTYHHQGIYSLAAAYYEALSQAHGAYPGADKALFAAALFREGGHEYDKAVKNLENYIARYGKNRRGPDVMDKYFRIGLLYRKQGKWKQVKKHFQRFLSRFKADPDRKIQALWQIAWATFKLMRRPKEKQLWKLFEKVLDYYADLPAEEKQKLKKAREALAQARLQQAEILFRKFQKMRLTNPRKIKKQLGAKARALKETGIAFYDVIRFKQAEWAIAAYARTGQIFQDFAKALVNSPAPRKLPKRLKQLYKEVMETRGLAIEKKAKEAYIKCLQTSRELKVYTRWTKMAETQLAVLMPREYALANEIKVQPGFAVDPDPAQGRSSVDVMAAYRKVLENDPSNAEAMNKLGTLIRRAGNWQKAVSYFRRALTVAPTNVEAYRNLAYTYYSIGKHDLAHLVLLNAKDLIGKDDAALLNNWGLNYLKRGEVAKAVGAFKRAIRVDENFAPARLNFGALALNYSDYDTAEREFTEALRIDGTQVEARLGLALALRGNRKYPAALAEYERVLQENPTHPGANFNIAILFQEFLDKPEQALNALQRFLRNGNAPANLRAEAETRIKNLRQLLDVMKKGKS